MTRLNPAIALTAITLTVLVVSCNQSQPTTTASSPADDSPATQASPNPAIGFSALTGVISSTRAAVQIDNFDQAKTAFDQFEASWAKVEDAVKAKSSDTYSAIEDGMDTVKAGIKAKDKNKTLTALQGLEQSLTKAAKA
jgi:uncharacterized protein YpuA (DUF1002 family)